MLFLKTFPLIYLKLNKLIAAIRTQTISVNLTDKHGKLSLSLTVSSGKSPYGTISKLNLPVKTLSLKEYRVTPRIKVTKFPFGKYTTMMLTRRLHALVLTANLLHKYLTANQHGHNEMT